MAEHHGEHVHRAPAKPGRARKVAVYAAALLAVIAVAVALGYYLVYLPPVTAAAQGDAAALASVNQRISQYGGSLRFLLQNRTLFLDSFNITSRTFKGTPPNYSALYVTLVAVSHYQASVAGLVANFGGSPAYSTLHGYRLSNGSDYDWNLENGSLRGTELGLFSTWGLPLLGSPPNSTALQDAYEMEAMGSGIYAVSSSISALLQSGMFGDQSYFVNASERLNYTARSTFGVAMYNLPLQAAGGFSGTTVLNASPLYTASDGAGVVASWIGVAANLGDPVRLLQTGGISTVRPLSLDSLFYLFAINQYNSYYFTQLFYNRSIAPEITVMAYSNNDLIIDLGNMNLTPAPRVSLSIDGNATGFSRHYDFLLANASLGVGLHNVTVTLNGERLQQPLYVSPAVMQPQGATITQNGTLTFSLDNIRYIAYYNCTGCQEAGNAIEIRYLQPPAGNVSISNISVGYLPAAFDGYNGTIYMALNESLPRPYPITGVIANVTNPYVANGTFRSDYVDYRQIPQGATYLLRSNSSVQLFFNLNQTAGSGSKGIFFFTADTNYGRARYVIYGQAG